METLEAICGRRTIRRYKQAPVGKTDLEALIDAARFAPSAGNTQRIRYAAVSAEPLVEKIFATTAWGAFVKPRRSPEWGNDAPTAFILLASIVQPADTIHADAGAATQNMALAALERGLGTCWIGSFDKKAVAEILELDESLHPLYLLAVGHPDETPVAETVDADADVKYYLGENDTLHVPKRSVEALTIWKL